MHYEKAYKIFTEKISCQVHSSRDTMDKELNGKANLGNIYKIAMFLLQLLMKGNDREDSKENKFYL